MNREEWVRINEAGRRLSVDEIGAALIEAGIPHRASEQPQVSGKPSILVPADRASEASRALSEASVTNEELTEQALATPPPDDIGSDSLVQQQVGAAFAKVVVAVSGIVLGGVALLTLGSLVHLTHPCVSTLLWDVPSPDRWLKVSVIRRQCRGDIPFGAVSILDRTQFVGRMSGGNILARVAHPQALSIRWEGPRAVVITSMAGDPLKLLKPWYMSGYGVVKVQVEPARSTPP